MNTGKKEKLKHELKTYLIGLSDKRIRFFDSVQELANKKYNNDGEMQNSLNYIRYIGDRIDAKYIDHKMNKTIDENIEIFLSSIEPKLNNENVIDELLSLIIYNRQSE